MVLRLMRLIAVIFVLAACGSEEGPTACPTNNCVCPDTEPCEVACTAKNACQLQCGAGQPCDLTCAPGVPCNVSCAATAPMPCNVDCAGSPMCHVQCPIEGCTVENCKGSGASCAVNCGTNGVGSRNGDTVTCP